MGVSPGHVPSIRKQWKLLQAERLLPSICDNHHVIGGDIRFEAPDICRFRASAKHRRPRAVTPDLYTVIAEVVKEVPEVVTPGCYYTSCGALYAGTVESLPWKRRTLAGRRELGFTRPRLSRDPRTFLYVFITKKKNRISTWLARYAECVKKFRIFRGVCLSPFFALLLILFLLLLFLLMWQLHWMAKNRSSVYRAVWHQVMRPSVRSYAHFSQLCGPIGTDSVCETQTFESDSDACLF